MWWPARGARSKWTPWPAEIEALGRRTLRVASDVLERPSLQRLHDAVIEKFGKVDILVNAAGMTKKVPTLEVDEADWSQIIETNLTGTLRACQIFGRTMAKARLRAHHQYRLGHGVSRVLSRGAVCGQQERSGFADQDAGDGAGGIGRERECDCAGRVSDRDEHAAGEGHAARRGDSDAHADASIWATRARLWGRRFFWRPRRRHLSPAK